MAQKKNIIVYRCTACGRVEPKWLGRCPECGEWNTLKEAAHSSPESGGAGPVFSLPITAIGTGERERFSSGSTELDRVLGGGIMRGASVLVGGEPGIGKSTLMLEVAARAVIGGRILYVSGEESPGQVRLRAERIGAMRDTLEVFCSGNLHEIIAVCDKIKPALVVVDSVQTLHAEEAGAIPGTANQIKFCAGELIRWVKERGSSLFLVAHVTKEGLIAGPKLIEHIVDCVLHFDQGESELRVLRASKNRFGATDEIGLFSMGPEGLRQVDDPSHLFLEQRTGSIPAGVAIAPVYEGSRAILVEIQALTVPAKGGLSRVYSERIESSRVARVAAVVEKQTGLRLADQDLYINVAGGLRLGEVGIDLALAMAIHSARTGIALPEHTALAGELSLAGEVRPLRRMKLRLRAATALGFSRLIGPPALDEKGDWKEVATVKAAVEALFGKSAARKSED